MPWFGQLKGVVFSVKIGYKSLCEDPQARESDSESAEVHRSMWKDVWRLNVLVKIKHFLWKSCTNLLPTKENLLKKTIISENVCHLCSEHLEDVIHAMWGCTKVRQVWQRSFGWLDHNLIAEGSFPNLVRLVQTKPSVFPLFAVMAWAVWHHCLRQRLPLARSVVGAIKWRPPSENVVKINFDGALFRELDCAGLGVVICNSEGLVLVALSEKIMKPQTAELVEILAARRAVLFSIETGFHNSVFEGDSTSSCSFSNVGRQDNAVAHALAQRARLSVPLKDWTLACRYAEDTEDVIDVSGLMTYLLVCSSSSKST
ncbi:uncharacterized protein LOC142632725 [Castanea sativa]|uniref:uncharacterized protein LOC142632725 n=1 Tax=Castanea sativa TaxID=21020 RepID=UPI003F649C9D